jgi:trehalose 6-phosphate synthase
VTNVADRPLVIVSNRGPVSFSLESGDLAPRRGAGGLVSGLGPLVVGTGATWIAAAISEGDRLAAERGRVDAEGFRVRMLALEPADYRMAYDVVCNATLWFVHHNLFDLARRPRFDMRWREAWESYRSMNHRFADVVAEEAPGGAIVLVQDYHLTLLAPRLGDARPDLRLVHFSHTPFAEPDAMRVLPSYVAEEMLAGMAAHDACGFHSTRWADAFTRSCRAIAGTDPQTFVAPLAPDPDDIASVARSAACDAALSELEKRIAGRSFIVRVDRIELSKNLLRGFHAFDDLLERYPQWRERVVFGAFCYPSREGLAEYLAYRQETEGLVSRLNAKWGTESWTPVLLDPSDDFPRSVAALRRFDVLLVNPIRDGLNLVAKEGALINEHDGTVVLSTEAGAWDELGGVVQSVNPYDIAATADALAAALATPAGLRRSRASELRTIAEARTPADWLADQIAAVG